MTAGKPVIFHMSAENLILLSGIERGKRSKLINTLLREHFSKEVNNEQLPKGS